MSTLVSVASRDGNEPNHKAILIMIFALFIIGEQKFVTSHHHNFYKILKQFVAVCCDLLVEKRALKGL